MRDWCHGVQADDVVASRRDGHGFESSHRQWTSLLRGAQLAMAPFLKSGVCCFAQRKYKKKWFLYTEIISSWFCQYLLWFHLCLHRGWLGCQKFRRSVQSPCHQSRCDSASHLESSIPVSCSQDSQVRPKRTVYCLHNPLINSALHW